jgi:hypothetical protein
MKIIIEDLNSGIDVENTDSDKLTIQGSKNKKVVCTFDGCKGYSDVTGQQ